MAGIRSAPEGSISDRIAAHLAAATYDAIPDDAIAWAKIRLLDSVGLIAAGAKASGSAETVRLVEDWGGRGDATILTAGTKVPAMHAALASAMLLRSYDFEPVSAVRADGRIIPSHITGTTVPVALAVAERVGASGRDLLTALVHGDDIAARLGHATGFELYGGGDNTGTINTLGATATAGILLGLDADGFVRALGIAVNQLGGTIDNIVDKTLAFKLPIALAARNAVFSAELAATGFGGPVDPIGGRFGFLNQWSSEPDVDRILDGLGAEFLSDGTIKPWPTCRASQPALDATLRIIAEHAVSADEVERVRVGVTPRTRDGFVGQPFALGASPEVSGAFSIEFAVATALLDGTVAFRHLTAAHAAGPRLSSMLDRVEIVGSLPPGETGTAEVEIDLLDGRRLRQRVETALGDRRFAPLDDHRIMAKYRDSIAWNGRIDPDRGERLRELVLGIEHEDRIDGIAQLLTG